MYECTRTTTMIRTENSFFDGGCLYFAVFCPLCWESLVIFTLGVAVVLSPK